MFEPFPKIPRLNREVVVTEKIDGTNAQILILPVDDQDQFEAEHGVPFLYTYTGAVGAEDIQKVGLFAGSRKKLIYPGKQTDNAGFAGWVASNATTIIDALGVGRHFGEWYGQGIQRGYGIDEKRFALFNTHRWYGVQLPLGITTVPILYTGPFNTSVINKSVELLSVYGSEAVPGYMNPEGVIVYHKAAGQLFKVTCEHDEKPKGSNESG